MTINNYSHSMSACLTRNVFTAALGLAILGLSACGGGGTQGDPLKVGSLALQPPSANFYALNPATLQIAGGRGPYNFSASEPTLVPSNFQLGGNTWNFTPNQPGVVDAGQDPNEVPSRSVIITVRDANGDQTTGTFKILQNFLVGYGLNISALTSCGAGGATTSGVEACAGSDSLLSLVPITNGLRLAGKQMRMEVRYGPFAFIQDGPPDGITGPSYTRSADSTGALTARIRVLPNAITQYAQFRLTDVATGAFRDVTFVVRNAAPETLSVVPSDLTFTGSSTAQCGFGKATLFPLGGKAPYRVTGSNSNFLITPSQVGAGEAFALEVGASTTCVTGSVIIADAEGKTATVAVKTETGTTPPVMPFTVTPTNIPCLANAGANSAQVIVNGGNTNKVVAISSPTLLNANPLNGTDTFVLQLTSTGNGGATLQNVAVTVSDGSANPATISVGIKATCP